MLLANWSKIACSGEAMTSEHWQHIEALYHSALKVSYEERTALLAQADPNVRRTVEAMFTQDGIADGVWIVRLGSR